MKNMNMNLIHLVKLAPLPDSDETQDSLREARLQTHIKYLSDEMLSGRHPGTKA